VAHHPEPLQVQGVGETAQVLHEVSEETVRGVRQPWLLCIAEAPEVGRHHVEVF
jgi:hypothetical protein